MNYLGHAYLSFGDTSILTGNMIADHIKGRVALTQLPAEIAKGVELHRKIDAFTDSHTATLRAKLLFRPDYGLYAGAVMDVLYDHFLANDPKLFQSENALFTFSQAVYHDLEANEAYFPPKFAEYFPYMKQYDWLYNYRTMKGIERSLGGLNRKAPHMPPPEKAYELFVTHYYHINQCYYEFIDDIVSYIKAEINK